MLEQLNDVDIFKKKLEETKNSFKTSSSLKTVTEIHIYKILEQLNDLYSFKMGIICCVK